MNKRSNLLDLLNKADTLILSRIAHIQNEEKYTKIYNQALADVKHLKLKSVNEVLREYQDTLERYVVTVANGNMTSGEMSRAHKTLLKRLASEAYKEGMKEGGIRDPEAEMEDEDDSTIDDWISEQSGYTLEFARACEAVSELSGDDKRTKRDALLDRVDEWVASMRYIGQRGYLSAKGNLPLTFDGDDGKESCATCDKYKGQRHRMSWWDKRGLLDRPNGNYDCGRFNCAHHFIDDEGDIVVD